MCKAEAQFLEFKRLADLQVDRLLINEDEDDDGSFSMGDKLLRNPVEAMLSKDYCPPEVIVELAKCILGMLHFRVLSWA